MSDSDNDERVIAQHEADRDLEEETPPEGEEVEGSDDEQH